MARNAVVIFIYLVEVEDEMGPVGDLESVLPAGQSLGLVLGELGEEVGEVDDDAVADDGLAVRPDDARGQEVEVVLLVSHDHGVAGVIPALKRKDDSVLLVFRIRAISFSTW